MSAVTSSSSPMTRLTACRPPSISGETRSMTMVRRVPTASGPGSYVAWSRDSGWSAGTAAASGGMSTARRPFAMSRCRDCLAASSATRRRVERVVVIFGLKPYPIGQAASGGGRNAWAGAQVACSAAMSPQIASPPRPSKLRASVVLTAFLAVALVLAACSQANPLASGSQRASAATTPPPSPSPTAAATASTRPGDPDHLTLEALASGLNRPINVTRSGDGSNRLFVNEQDGDIRVVGPDGALRAEPFLDIRGLVLSGGERGLLGLAFHPGFPAQPRIYVDYTRVPDGATVIAQSQATA